MRDKIELGKKYLTEIYAKVGRQKSGKERIALLVQKTFQDLSNLIRSEPKSPKEKRTAKIRIIDEFIDNICKFSENQHKKDYIKTYLFYKISQDEKENNQDEPDKRLDRILSRLQVKSGDPYESGMGILGIPFLPLDQEIKWLETEIEKLKKDNNFSEEKKLDIEYLEARLAKKRTPKLPKEVDKKLAVRFKQMMLELEQMKTNQEYEKKLQERKRYFQEKLESTPRKNNIVNGQDTLEVLHFINRIIKENFLHEDIDIKECACAQHFDRRGMDKSVRDSVDELAVKHVEINYPKQQHPTITILSIGSGNLKQELSVAGNLMKTGYNIQLILVDSNYRGLSKINNDGSLNQTQSHGYNNTFKQFKIISNALQQKYGKKLEIIGCFSGLEPYQSILTDKPLKGIDKEKVEKTTAILNTNREIKLTAPNWKTDRNEATNTSYKQEKTDYQESCNVVPDFVMVVDSIDEFRPDFEIDPDFELEAFGSMASEKIEKRRALYSHARSSLIESIEEKSPSHKTIFLETTKNSVAKLVKVEIAVPEKKQTSLVQRVYLDMHAEENTQFTYEQEEQQFKEEADKHRLEEKIRSKQKEQLEQKRIEEQQRNEEDKKRLEEEKRKKAEELKRQKEEDKKRFEEEKLKKEEEEKKRKAEEENKKAPAPLILSGGPINAKQDELNKTLLKAITKKNLDEVRKALRDGAKINSVSTGKYARYNAIQLAVFIGDKAIVETLLKEKPDLNHKNDLNQTLLEIASISINEEMIELIENLEKNKNKSKAANTK